MIRAGLGFALLPDYATSILPKGVVVKMLALNPPPRLSLVVAHRRTRHDVALTAFKKILCESFAAPEE